MTNKEAIKILRSLYNVQSLDTLTQEEMTAVAMAIKSLEAWEKVRAEIECLTITKGGEDYTRKMAELFALKIKILQIIDKYLAEVSK